ncbi:MAG TPA: hypothetical protein VFU68_03295 [Terracidiphilus sp.]|nr:hypothetical protein [Terracidiphilus sp.]
MALTVDQILGTKENQELFDLLSAELVRLLPDSVQEDRDLFHHTVATLPRGLRAMAGIYSFDASMTMDSLAWHFGNQNDPRDLQETLNGLRELEMPDIAEMFEQMWNFMKPHMQALQDSDYGGKDFSDWLVDIGAEDFAKEKDRYIWDYCKKTGKFGLLESWAQYARKYPERCTMIEAQS